MAAQGGVLFQEKVSRLLSRQDGKPVLKPNRPLALKDAVANRKLKKGGNDMNKDGVTTGSLYRRWLIVASLVQTAAAYAAFTSIRSTFEIGNVQTENSR